MPRPLIGITCDHNSRPVGGDSSAALKHSQYILPHVYTIAIEKAGGLPIMLPYRSDALIENYVDLCDGFVLSGGDDYDPTPWGESRHPKAVAMDPAREKFDRAIVKAIEARNKPVLGICAGCQIMNLSRGGTLHQFVP
ncbi:MAG TPA: gamma-glutamyl-gamma-aminobutyrate hydrolase family protein, partial [Tepidisphaeraceae bacterium]|nr:gamma-glutamyl-gamma-aminobutyrate hydrolase family protein [Tepidisphaeraceae bacterium]